RELLPRPLVARRPDRRQDRLDPIDPAHARDLLDEIDLARDVRSVRRRLVRDRAVLLFHLLAAEALEDRARLRPRHRLAEELVEARRAEGHGELLRLGIAGVDLPTDRRAACEAGRQRDGALEDL